MNTAENIAENAGPAPPDADREAGTEAPVFSHSPLIRSPRRDLVARPRDEKGAAILPRPVSEQVLMDPKPLSETALAPTVAIIRARRPDLAHALEDEHDRHVVHAIKEIDSVREEEDRLLPERTRQAEARNQAVDDAQAGIRVEQTAALGPLHERLAERDEALAAAHDAAKAAFGDANGRYDPRDPSEAGLPFPKELPEDVVAAELRLPWPLAEKVFQLPAWLHWTFTAFVGLLVGVGLALVTHALEVETLPRHPVEVLLAWAIGACLAEIVWRALRARWYDAAHSFYAEEPRGRFWTALAVALLVTVGLVGADVTIVQHGLLAIAASQASLGALSYRGTPGNAPDFSEATALWFMSLIVSLGYMTFATAQGAAEGRNAAVRNRIRHYQTMDLLQQEAAFAERPAVRAARAALADVLRRQGQRDAAQAHIAEETRPFTERLSYWESQRMPGLAELTLQKSQRIQDARQDALQAQADFYVRLRQALEASRLPTPRKDRA